MQFSEAGKKLAGAATFELLAKARSLEKQGQKLFHFEIGDTDFDTPQHIKEAGIKAIRDGETHYVDSQGLSSLREAIAKDAEKELGFLPEIDQIVVAPGKAFIYLLSRILVNPGEEIIVPDPGFTSYYPVFDFIGAKWKALPVLEENNFEVEPQDVERLITDQTRLIILNSPHNPTGGVTSQEKLTQIARIAQERGIYILSDEVYSKLVFDGKHASPAGFDQCQKNVILINSFSKNFAMTGWRLGWMIGSREVAQKVKYLLQHTISSLPAFIQEAGREALTGDQYIVQKNLADYRIRRDEIVKVLNDIPGIKCLLPAGGIYVFPNISGTGMSSEEFAEFALQKAGVVVIPGTVYGEYGRGHVRLVFGAIGTEEIREGLNNLKNEIIRLRN